MVHNAFRGKYWLAACVAVAWVAGAAGQQASQERTPAPVKRTAYAAGSPARWLSHEGKPDAWYTATEPCRRLLDQLKTNQPLVARRLPSIRRYAEILRRVGKFNWKTITAVEYLQNMLEDLAAGKAPNVRYAGKGMAFPYWSETMRRIEAIWTHVPPGYDPGASHQVFIYYKCGGGIHYKNGKAAGGYRPTAEVANQTDTFHCWSSLNIQIKGRQGGHIELAEAMDALCREFSVDRDRVFLTGWSDGGFTAVWLASHYPHLVAGIAPNCGNWQYSNVFYLGLANLPTLNVDGWFDGGYNNISFVRWQLLRGDHADTACIWGQHGHSYQPYEDVKEFKYILDWAKKHKRDLYPKRVRYATWNLQWHRAYWASIERRIDPLLACQIDLEIKPDNRIEGRTWNVAELKLSLCEKLLDMARPVKVVLDGKEVYTGSAKAELDIELSPRPEGPFVKDAAMPDEITAVTDGSTYNSNGFLSIPARRWLAVRPTAMDEAAAKLLAKWWPEGAKADKDVTEADLAECNLMLYGGPEVNTLTARITDRLPVQFGKGRFSVGADVYDKPTHCIAFLHPNPLNPKKYVLVYAFNDPAAFARHGFFGIRWRNIWRFRSGDAVIWGIPAEPVKWGVAIRGAPFTQRHVTFGPDWKVDRREPIGEATAAFDYLQLLRLRADALREATGADVGIIWSYTSGWNRWVDGLPAGPVTLQALGTQNALPEQVCVGEMTGRDLLRPRGEPAAWSLLDDKRQPGYVVGKTLAVSDIKPDKTYRVAMGYSGIPAYGTNPRKMPRLFTWSTQQEFLANENNSIRIRNLTRTPMQVVQAVARYVRAHKRIAPRPIDSSLTDYLMNPKVNDFGGYDWLHLGADVAWPDKAAGGPQRYTISLGARSADAPESAKPPANYRHFADLDLATGGRTAFDFAGLDRKLPLAATTETRRWAIVADASGKGYALADQPAAKAVGGATLLLVHLASKADKDIALRVTLNRDVMSRVNGQTWPDGATKKIEAYFAGYHRAIGRYRQPPTHEDAVLLLSAGKAPRISKLVAPNAGYNFGLVGVDHSATVQAGKTLSVPMLIIWAARPDKDADVSLLDALMALKRDLIKRLPADSIGRG